MKNEDEETWCQSHLADQQLHRLLEKVDADLAHEACQQGCLYCEGKLHRADYDRKPRGGPQWERRYSFCCAQEDCRRRRTRPTLLEISDHSMPIAQEEVFGAVLVMQAFDSEEEAVALANDSQYGLAASIWSTNVDRPLRIARQIEAGTVWINNWAIIYAETEEGGYKQSGLGRLDGVSGTDDFVEYRTIIHEIDLGASH